MGSVMTTADVDVITGITVSDLDSTAFMFSIVDPSKTNGWFDINPSSVSQFHAGVWTCMKWSRCFHLQGDIYVPAGTVINREQSGNLINAAGQAVVTFDIQVSDGQFTGTSEV